MFGQSLVHANFSVDDLEAAKAFYCDKLGFKLIREFDGQAFLQAGGDTKINIYQKDDHTPWNATVLGIEVDDVLETLEALQGLGISAEHVADTDESGVATIPGMGEAAWFKDPAGNWICISHLGIA